MRKKLLFTKINTRYSNTELDLKEFSNIGAVGFVFVFFFLVNRYNHPLTPNFWGASCVKDYIKKLQINIFH